ncbi:GGDEF domain-containing protein [Rubrivivax albus]|uniref:diguanylate cyclase n=1 Tax=Rubrivivax albus TaxID=2499835 RepID=A0A437JRY1_9BURK|nr:GGDEF domain-containing protein [Rubrivivax albus]RVT49708.1 GGDEF domain-containing protein [Rubrivivax albus]
MSEQPVQDPTDPLAEPAPNGWRGALMRMGPRRAVVAITLLSIVLSVSITLAAGLARDPVELAWIDLTIAVTVPSIVAPLAASMIVTLMHEVEVSRRALRELALRDDLTRLYNRRYFMARLQAEVARAHREQTPLAVCMIDVDHFKRINDERGHAAGDAVLAHLAGVLLGSLRPYDLAARCGGEEFAALLPGATLREAEQAAQRLRQAIAAARVPAFGATPLPHVTASLGVSGLGPGEDGSALLTRADRAMYAAKTGGRNRCVSLPAAVVRDPQILGDTQAT